MTNVIAGTRSGLDHTGALGGDILNYSSVLKS